MFVAGTTFLVLLATLCAGLFAGAAMPPDAAVLLARWGRLHAVRSVVAFVFLLLCLAGTGAR